MISMITDAAHGYEDPAVKSGSGDSLELLILQSTSFCNLACDYCYLPDKDAVHRLELPTLAAIFDQLFDSSLPGERLTIVWHAGEPLVLGTDYYRQAFAIIEARRPASLRVTHDFQTNGTLLDQDWCDLIQEHDAHIGLSIDGPAFLHDVHRKRRDGAGTLAAVLRGVEWLQKNQIDFHVITVLTRAALNFPDELYHFYLDHGIRRVGFNVEELEGAHQSSSLSTLGTEQAFRRFINRFLQLTTDETPPRLSVREFDSFFHALLSRCELPLANQQVRPGAIVTIDTNGRLATYSPELLGIHRPDYDDFIVGHIEAAQQTKPVIKQNAFDPLIAYASTSRLGREIAEGVEMCRSTCRYFDLCGGGAPANKLFENGRFDSTETLYCRLSRQLLIDCLLDFAESRLDDETRRNNTHHSAAA
jgi:uncharacterized protein